MDAPIDAQEPAQGQQAGGRTFVDLHRDRGREPYPSAGASTAAWGEWFRRQVGVHPIIRK